MDTDFGDVTPEMLEELVELANQEDEHGNSSKDS